MKAFFTFLSVSLSILFVFNSSAQNSEFLNTPPEVVELKVIPPEYSTVPGTATFTGPLANTARTLQFLIHDTLLVDLVGKELTGISWRLPTSATAVWPAADATYTGYDIYLGESVTPAARSLTFADNIVGALTLVRSGSLVISAGVYTFGNTPNDWGPTITFNDNWLYTGGHLLIEIRTSTHTSTSRSVDAIGTSITGYGTLFSACWGSGSTATSGSQGNFTVLQLTADLPIPVELTSFSAVAIGNNVELMWKTATETNNSGFEVQRKSSTSDFRQIGFISGAGTTTELNNYSFTDSKLPAGKYSYRLKQLDFDGTYEFSNNVDVDIFYSADFVLAQNYPNPFNPSTKISWQAPVDSRQTLKIYNILGIEVATLVDEYKPAGIYEIDFDASSLSSGIYFYKLQAGSFIETKKMILLK